MSGLYPPSYWTVTGEAASFSRVRTDGGPLCYSASHQHLKYSSRELDCCLWAILKLNCPATVFASWVRRGSGAWWIRRLGQTFEWATVLVRTPRLQYLSAPWSWSANQVTLTNGMTYEQLSSHSLESNIRWWLTPCFEFLSVYQTHGFFKINPTDSISEPNRSYYLHDPHWSSIEFQSHGFQVSEVSTSGARWR